MASLLLIEEMKQQKLISKILKIVIFSMSIDIMNTFWQLSQTDN